MASIGINTITITVNGVDFKVDTDQAMALLHLQSRIEELEAEVVTLKNSKVPSSRTSMAGVVGRNLESIPASDQVTQRRIPHTSLKCVVCEDPVKKKDICTRCDEKTSLCSNKHCRNEHNNECHHKHNPDTAGKCRFCNEEICNWCLHRHNNVSGHVLNNHLVRDDGSTVEKRATTVNEFITAVVPSDTIESVNQFSVLAQEESSVTAQEESSVTVEEVQPQKKMIWSEEVEDEDEVQG